MPKVYPPELKRYMDKEVELRLNGARKVKGFVRGFDPFMNLVLDDAVESSTSADLGMIVIRGNAIMAIEAKDRTLD